MRVIRRPVVHGALCSIVLATTASAQHSGATATETIATRVERDLNGHDIVNERVVTHRSQTSNEERVIVETYTPSIEAGRLALRRRVERVTSLTGDARETVEETAENNPASISEPMRIVKRSVTTIRTDSTGSTVSERQEFERDTNGRLVLVRTVTEQSRN
jgi:hypothetical protein